MWYREGDGGVYLNVKVVPRASRDSIGPVEGDHVKVRVTAPPVDGEANGAVVKLLSKKLGVPKRAITIVKGETSRTKVVFLEGVSPREVEDIAS